MKPEDKPYHMECDHCKKTFYCATIRATGAMMRRHRPKHPELEGKIISYTYVKMPRPSIALGRG